MTREKLTVTLDDKLIKELEEERTKTTKHSRAQLDKSHFIERLLIIGLNAYKQKQIFFDKLDLNNIDLSKINY